MASKTSPFLYPGSVAAVDSLAIIHLKRDHQIPAILKAQDEDDDGYEEGKVVNTQFGSFPHRTLIGIPWGSQVRASKVDTGSRGRKLKGGEKRKREDSKVQDTEERRHVSATGKAGVTASSGFMHVLAPTPENWTASLPHRTQVVYTPDYSYILHRIRARPGSSIIEAGAGSGSFTHASARAVYNGYPADDSLASSPKRRRRGKVWSFEFHEQRHAKLEKEIRDHALEGIVQITHRDVCGGGFLVGPNGNQSPNADAVFLDLPAPWLALPHLTRQAQSANAGISHTNSPASPEIEPTDFISALNTHTPVHLCSFSPCIEQVQRTVSTLRHLGWVDISVVEVSHKRLEIRRERIGIENGLQRGTLATAANVEEAVARLKEVEGRFKNFHGQNEDDEDDSSSEMGNNGKNGNEDNVSSKRKVRDNPNSKEKILESLVERKIYKEGRLVHRSEPEIKTHTSYLLFAILPQEWSAEAEDKARAKWPLKKGEASIAGGMKGEANGMSKRQKKKAAREARTDGAGQKQVDAVAEILEIVVNDKQADNVGMIDGVAVDS